MPAAIGLDSYTKVNATFRAVALTV